MRQSIVGDFQQMTMLRIELLGFARAHTEGCSIEAPDVVDHARGKRVAASDLVRRWMIESLWGETIRSDPAYRRAIVPEERPERINVRSPRHTGRITNDSDFVTTCHRRNKPLYNRR